ncbi:MAG: magnesium transporter CorA family protein [Chthoniobacterales bacterium]
MITFYPPAESGVELSDLNLCPELTRKAIWIDLFEPTLEEEHALEAALGIDVPTREEMQEIELSSRLHKEKDVLFMTGTVLLKADTRYPESAVVTFILSPERLIVTRYADALPFKAFRTEREKNPGAYKSGYDILAGMIDAIIDRVADILENVGKSLDALSLQVFDTADKNGLISPGKSPSEGARHQTAQHDFSEILRRVGAVSDLISRARESLVSFGRLASYFREQNQENALAREAVAHMKTVAGDVGSLSDHATFLSGKVSFLLDATLGMIANEQNVIIKIISVAAVVFLLPTLVAGIYGMNFHFLPELSWRYGYAFALLLMVISSILPYLYFKRKGWL